MGEGHQSLPLATPRHLLLQEGTLEASQDVQIPPPQDDFLGCILELPSHHCFEGKGSQTAETVVHDLAQERVARCTRMLPHELLDDLKFGSVLGGEDLFEYTGEGCFYLDGDLGAVLLQIGRQSGIAQFYDGVVVDHPQHSVA